MLTGALHDVLRVRSILLAAALIAAISWPAIAAAQASLRLVADPSSPGGGNQQVVEPAFDLGVINIAEGDSEATAHDVQLLIVVSDPILLSSVTLELDDGATASIGPNDLEEGTPAFACTGRPLPPHGIYPAPFAVVELGDIPAGGRVDMSVVVAGSEGLTVHFEAIGERLRQHGNATVCSDLHAPPGHHVTARPGGGPIPPTGCDGGLEATSDVDAVELGGQVVFTFTAVASGDCDLTSAVLTNTVPIVVDPSGQAFAAFTVLSVDPPDAVVSDTEIAWDLGALPAGGTATATATVVFDEPRGDGHEIVNAACLTADQLDEPICDNAVVAVGEVVRRPPIGGPGFWCRHLRGALDGHRGGQLSLDDLSAWLTDVNNASLVFTALYDTSSLELARPLICRPTAPAADRLARQLMTLWLNVVSERVRPDAALGGLCPGDEEPPDETEPGWTVAFVLDEAESALLYGADDRTLLFWMEVIDFVNSGRSPEDCAAAPRRLRGPRRPTP